MAKIFVDELQDKQAVNTIFQVRDKVVLTGKTKKQYIGMSLADKTGTIDARVWDNVEELKAKCETGDYILVQGFVQTFQGRKQLIVSQISKLLPKEVNADDFITRAAVSSELMMQELNEYVAKVKDEKIRQLIINTLQDPEIGDRFKRCPAAKTIHHAYYGGLLEHCLSISKIMHFLSQHYPMLNYDLLIFGAIFHDIGKLWELTYDTAIGYTDQGRLVGHLVIGVELVEKQCQKISDFSTETKDILKHIILSHHGKLEFGSPKRPKLLEALVVAFIDEMDSKINTINTFVEEELKSGEKWTRYNQMFDRYFYLQTYREDSSDESSEESEV